MTNEPGSLTQDLFEVYRLVKVHVDEHEGSGEPAEMALLKALRECYEDLFDWLLQADARLPRETVAQDITGTIDRYHQSIVPWFKDHQEFLEMMRKLRLALLESEATSMDAAALHDHLMEWGRIFLIPLREDQATIHAQRFKALAHPTRLRLLSLFSTASEALCFSDIIATGIGSASPISHHLRMLYQADLLSRRKEGLCTFYTYNQEHAQSLFEQSLSVF